MAAPYLLKMNVLGCQDAPYIVNVSSLVQTPQNLSGPFSSVTDVIIAIWKTEQREKDYLLTDSYPDG